MASIAATRDSLNILTRFNGPRLRNAVKVYRSFKQARTTKNPIHPALPVSLSFEPTTACNLRCPECPSGLRSFSRPTGRLQTDLFRKVLDDVSSHVAYMTLYFQGEPYLNPDFLELVQMASQRNIYTATSTNAHFLDDEHARRTVESGLDRLIISIDGTTQTSYESYRREGSLEKVLEGSRNIIKWKKKLRSQTPYTFFQFLVVKPNEHEIPVIRQLAKEIGVDDLRLKTAQVYDFENGNPLIPDQDKYSRYRKLADGKYAVKNSLDDQCWRMWHSCVITWDGRVVPCCFDKDATHNMGSLQENSFSEIWNGAAYQNFRRSLFSSRSEIDICKNCSEGTKVWG
ncbi:MAG: SPASM domain-containing protein [Flavobacteriales bacterium]|nr:SPASM domain-containing protein [Flavobacteriales bacterium]MCB9446824.1 SPASM domain-containing protein [Flavobacteriales bacterium]